MTYFRDEEQVYDFCTHSLKNYSFDIQKEWFHDIEDRIKELVGTDIETVEIPEDTHELEQLLIERYHVLQTMFKETPEAYERMAKVNEHLFRLTNQIQDELANVCEKLVQDKSAFADDYQTEASLKFVFGDMNSVIGLPQLDAEYESDYPLMIYLNFLLQESKKKNGVEILCIYNEPREQITENILDDGQSWAHEIGVPFEGICVCHTSAVFVRDLRYPVFDLLHMNNFWSEIHVKHQHFSKP